MAIINPWTNPNKLTIRHRFNNEYIPDRFDKLIIHFRNFLAGYIKYDTTSLHIFDSDDIAYCDMINFAPEVIAKDIKNTVIKHNRIFSFDRFMYLLKEPDMVKTSITSSGDPRYLYITPGIVFEVKVARDNKSEFDMSITLLDGYDESKPDSVKASWVKAKTDLPTAVEPKVNESKVDNSEEDNLSDDLRAKLNAIRNWAAYSKEPKVIKVVDPRVDNSEEERSELNTRAEKAISSVEANYLHYKNTLRSLGSNITKEDVEKLEALSKAIRIASYSIARPTTPENMLENLMSKGIIKPEFKMAFTSMFDNLIKDPLRYFFAKYDGAKSVELNEKVLTLDFQFERKLYSMYFDYTNLTKLEDREKLATLLKEALTELYEIREHFLRDLLGATGDLITYLKLVEDRDVDNDNLSPLFYDYVYNKIMAFKTLASTYEADVFVNNPTVAKCKEMESSIDEITTKTQEWLTKSKTNIAKLFYNQLQ